MVGASAIVYSIMSWIPNIRHEKCGSQISMSDSSSANNGTSGSVPLVERCGVASECPGDSGNWCTRGNTEDKSTSSLKHCNSISVTLNSGVWSRCIIR